MAQLLQAAEKETTSAIRHKAGLEAAASELGGGELRGDLGR